MSRLKKLLIIISILTCIVSLIIVGYIFIRDYLECNSNNEDIIGWIEIEDTEINYPVLKDSDNLYYLKHNYLKSITVMDLSLH